MKPQKKSPISRKMFDGMVFGSAALISIAALFVSTRGLASNLTTSGSVALNYSNDFGPHRIGPNGRLQGFSVEAAIRSEYEINETFSVAARACYSCHGFEVDSVYAEVRLKEQFNFRAGRISVPFGEFMVRRDVANYPTSSKPLPYEMGYMLRYDQSDLNLGVVPAPYVDNGIMFYGSFWPSEHAQFWYGAYIVSGFKGSNDFDFIAQRNIFYVDNNNTPAGGGQVNFTLFEPSDRISSFSLGASSMFGTYDTKNNLTYWAYAGHAGIRFLNANLHVEYAARRTDLDTSLPGYRYAIIDDFFTKQGAYLELDHGLKNFMPGLRIVYRADGLRRLGQPLPGSVLSESDIQVLRYTQGFLYQFKEWLALKTSYELWWLSDTEYFHHVLHAGFVLSY